MAKNKIKTQVNILKHDIKPLFGNNPTIVEAGAHIGIDTIKMAEIWPESTIHAFEPVSRLFRKLKRNTKRYPNIHCYKLGLSDINGQQLINISSGTSDGSSSLLKPKKHLEAHPTVIFSKTQKINTTTLDKWATQIGIKQIDLLWLDIQGMELLVLQKSLNLLKNTKTIFIEVSLIENYQDIALYPKIKYFLGSLGFYVKKEYLYWDDGGNVLFVKKKQ